MQRPRAMLLALGAVLLAHWLVLGPSVRWLGFWDSAGHTAASQTDEPVGPVMQTRSIPQQAMPPQPVQQSVPADATPTASRRAATAQLGPEHGFLGLPPAELPAAPTLPDALDLAQKPPVEPINTSQAATESIAKSATAQTQVAQERLQRYAFPPSVRLNYDVNHLAGGRRDTGGAKLLWKHDGTNYEASLIATKFYFKMRQWTSKGTLTDAGLTPIRFGDKGRGSEVAAHFVRDEGKIVFSANTPEAPLLPGAQDHLSVFMQLASLWAGEPQRYAAGDSISFQSIGPRQSETWTFVVSPEETITVPGGTFPAIKLTREASGDYSTKAELWLAPKLAYLPAHIRLTETNGNVLDMVWTDSEQP